MELQDSELEGHTEYKIVIFEKKYQRFFKIDKQNDTMDGLTNIETAADTTEHLFSSIKPNKCSL